MCCYSKFIIIKNIIKQHKNNKRKIIARTGNDEFKLPDGSYSRFY